MYAHILCEVENYVFILINVFYNVFSANLSCHVFKIIFMFKFFHLKNNSSLVHIYPLCYGCSYKHR